VVPVADGRPCARPQLVVALLRCQSGRGVAHIHSHVSPDGGRYEGWSKRSRRLHLRRRRLVPAVGPGGASNRLTGNAAHHGLGARVCLVVGGVG